MKSGGVCVGDRKRLAAVAGSEFNAREEGEGADVHVPNSYRAT